MGGVGRGVQVLQASLAHPDPCRWAHRPPDKARPARAGPGVGRSRLGLEGSVLGPATVTLDGAPGPRSPAPGWVRMPRTPLQELSGKQPAWARVLQAQPSRLALMWEPRQLLERRRAVCDSGQERPAGSVSEDGGIGGPTGVPAGWTGRTQVQAPGSLRLEGAAPQSPPPLL